jgi:hypothetical protein
MEIACTAWSASPFVATEPRQVLFRAGPPPQSPKLAKLPLFEIASVLDQYRAARMAKNTVKKVFIDAAT